MLKISCCQQSRNVSQISQTDHEPKQTEATLAINQVLMKSRASLLHQAAPAESKQYGHSPWSPKCYCQSRRAGRFQILSLASSMQMIIHLQQENDQRFTVRASLEHKRLPLTTREEEQRAGELEFCTASTSRTVSSSRAPSSHWRHQWLTLCKLHP